jgi:hypothetical protein
MRTRYIRTQPGRYETLAAAAASIAVAVGVGAVAFYLARLLLAREAIRDSGDVSVASDGEVTRVARRRTLANPREAIRAAGNGESRHARDG